MKTYHLVTAVIGTLITALMVWTLLIWASMWLGMKAYERGDYAAAQDYYATAERISPLDRWRPDFGQGTALLAQDRIDEGIMKLEEALDTVPEAEIFEGGVKDPNSYECQVRANLYLGYAAAERDEDAEAIIETCPNPNPSATGGGEEDPNGGGEGDSENDGDDPEEEGENGTDTGNQPPQDPQQEELEQRNREADQQRQREHEYRSGDGGGRQENW
ncbi:tetratricopeptide repeat protein [Flaviflexus massiliensis]|uniref:tetratricopeptide repeat protein n=1 Tax=Flaviflexus massiliensis TaxID=1522309 RepID=UPI0006D544FD|nr:hypothetical protein [Flaviflexus massiliensis]